MLYQIAAVSPQVWVYGMKYAAISVSPAIAVISRGICRFIDEAASCEDCSHEEVHEGSNGSRAREIRESSSSDSNSNSDSNDYLANILAFQCSQLIRFAGKISGRCKKLFTDQRVVAGRDEKWQLGRLCCACDLDRTN